MLSKTLRDLAAVLVLAAATTLPATLAQSADGVQLSPIDLENVAHGQSITIGSGKARIIRLQVDVRDVLVANPAVADVIVKTPRTIYILGNEVGGTVAHPVPWTQVCLTRRA